MKRRVLILFLSAVLLSGCAGGGRLDSYYNFSGRVYEKGTTHPISGILVKVQPGSSWLLRVPLVDIWLNTPGESSGNSFVSWLDLRTEKPRC